MKLTYLLLTLLTCWASGAQAADRDPASKEKLREAFLEWRFGMFIHFNMATFHEVEWANGYEPQSSFQPDQLNCEQWAVAAVSAGMQYAVLTVKHTGGWCLWNSQTTKTHAMSAFSNYKNGRGDIVRDFIKACRSHGLKVGLYYCFPRDFGHPEDKESLRGLPPEARDNPLVFVKQQLTELLTQYGAIDLLWCDQYQFDLKDNWPEIMQHVHDLQPNCLIIANNSRDFAETDIYSYEYPWLVGRDLEGLPPPDNQVPTEVCDKMEPSWFWKSDQEWNLKDAAQIVEFLKISNARNANYLLNVAPDRTGLIPEASVRRLEEVGAILRSESGF